MFDLNVLLIIDFQYLSDPPCFIGSIKVSYSSITNPVSFFFPSGLQYVKQLCVAEFNAVEMEISTK